MPTIFRIWLVVALALSSILPMAHARLWTNTEGKSFEGDLIEVESNIAVIRRRDDFWTFRVPVKELSEEDQEYIESYQNKESESQPRKAGSDAKEQPVVSIKANTNINFRKLEISVKRLSNFNRATISWYDKKVEGWIFTQIPWQAHPNYEVTFNRSGTVYIVRMSEFSSEDNLKNRKVEPIAKGAWINEQQWYEVKGKEGDSFTCTGPECMILADGFYEEHN